MPIYDFPTDIFIAPAVWYQMSISEKTFAAVYQSNNKADIVHESQTCTSSS